MAGQFSLNHKQLQQFAPNSPVLAFRPQDSGSPQQDWCKHLQAFPHFRRELEEFAVLGDVVVRIADGIEPAPLDRVKILSLEYAIKTLKNETDAREFVRAVKAIASEDAGLYTTMPDVHSSQSFNTMLHQLPQSSLSGTPYATAPRAYAPNNVYSVIEGSPTYKQRRRRSSIPPGTAAAVTAVGGTGGAHAVHRQSDLRRSVSASVGPVAEGDEEDGGSPSAISSYANIVQQQKERLESSRHGTPLPTLEGSPAPHPLTMLPPQEQYAGFPADHPNPPAVGNAPARLDRPGPIRRARSATMMELGPYPHKSHSCPIPTCGRLFKRLEHLKRYVGLRCYS